MRAFGLLFVLYVALAPLSAAAHHLPLATTTIEYSDDRSSLLITHRLSANDAARLLGTIKKANHQSLDDPKNQARLALVVAKEFRLSTNKKDTIMADIIGFELSDEYLYIYQEVPINGQPQLYLKSSILRQFKIGWMNFISIETTSPTANMTFIRGSDWQLLQY
ncbi:MAG: DUF6702 family protein [bacterium]